jgi:hypothetical protein
MHRQLNSRDECEHFGMDTLKTYVTTANSIYIRSMLKG